ncbi:UPF0505 protein C16orf62 homolog isoform X2 [Cimex lectularius]|uniref:VPS35 endosomal protein-sorting factor-like n=1 Tax=Cimex lectularius TaxID=79782 RepID=A0A8I6SUW0_CIMLE|nr:UPF0505 protein C16orf62 homolog isoform X2 [Cimex lectularius]
MNEGKARQLKWEWVCQVPKRTLVKHHMIPQETVDHPLKFQSSAIVNRGLKKTSDSSSKDLKPVLNDPLLNAVDDVDPLTALAAEQNWYDMEEKPEKNKKSNSMNGWNEQCHEILNKYITTKKLSMATGIISMMDKRGKVPNAARDALKNQPNLGMKNRLEQLDDLEEVDSKEMSLLTQQEYIDNINDLKNEIVQAWQQHFRVKALKITIQCSKLLVDTSVVQFYPNKFVLITNTLDTFGNLVYERLWNKSENQQEIGSSSESVSSTTVTESTKETCRNWFYKIASIRELIPRLYVEAAILKSYCFLSDNEFSSSLKRLMMMTRGIGDPLVSIYARCYLCKIGISSNNINRKLMRENFMDFLQMYCQLFSTTALNEVSKQKIDMPTYLNSFIPAIDWMLNAAIRNIDEPELDELVDSCCKMLNKGLLLNSILRTCDASYIAKRESFFMQQITSSTDDFFPFHITLKCMGEKLRGKIVSNPETIFEDAWKLISQLSNSNTYFSCILAWNYFIVKFCSLTKLNSLLEDIISHFGTGSKAHCPLLHEIIMSIVENIPNLEVLFTLDKFLPLLDLFGNDDLKIVTSKKILDLFAAMPNKFKITDPVTTDALIFLAKILHDSINILSVDDEKRQIGNLISQIIMKIDFGMKMESQLSFYVEARATFTNLDTVVVTLIHSVNKLAMEMGKKVKSHHTRKTASFVHACAAYSFITIPSIRSEITKLQLYLLTAQIALFNQCLGQADACIKSALSLILELPQNVEEVDGKSKSNEPFLQEYVQNMLSTLIILPVFLKATVYLPPSFVVIVKYCAYHLFAYDFQIYISFYLMSFKSYYTTPRRHKYHQLLSC